MGDNRPVRYVEDDGLIVYRASGLALCDRVYVALDQSYEPMAFPAWFQEVLDEGTRMEDTIRDKWVEHYGDGVKSDQLEVELEVMPGVVIRGHIDGVANGRLWEAKKVRPSGWDDFVKQGVEWHKNYPMQFSVYIHALREMGIIGKDEGGYFVGGLYDPEAEDIIEIFSHYYHDAPINMLGIRKRIAKLEGLIDSGKHVMDVACPSTADYPCPFYYLHDDDSPEPKERPGDDVILPLLEELTKLTADRKVPAAEVKRIDDRIKAVKQGITGWWEGAGLEPGDTADIEGWDVKVTEVARKGYEVKPGGYTKVTVKKSKGKK